MQEDLSEDTIQNMNVIEACFKSIEKETFVEKVPYLPLHQSKEILDALIPVNTPLLG